MFKTQFTVGFIIVTVCSFSILHGLVYGFLQKTVKHWFFNEFHNITFSGDRTVTVNRNRKTVKP